MTQNTGGIDPLNLWRALPPTSSQFIALGAVHASDESCDKDSLFNSESSELTPGFISDNDDGVPDEDQEWVAKMVPVTTRRVRNAHRGTLVRPRLSIDVD